MSAPVAYLTSRYPQVSHTFIQREVLALRAAGQPVETFAIRRAQPDEVLSAVDRAEFARTASILPVGPLRLAATHLRALAGAPGAYLRTLARALRLSPGGGRATLWRLFYFAEAILLWAACRERGLRHVHVHFANVAADVALLATAYGRAAAPGERWSWSFTMHGPTEFADTRLHRLPEKAADAAFVVCISDFARSQVMALLPESAWGKLPVVHCGVDTAAYAPVARASRDDGALHVLCVGRLVPEKGQAVLLDALGRVRAAGRDVRLTFVGDGPSRPALEATARERGLDGAVTFAGAVGQDEIRDLYAAADVFCLPSFAEGVPVVLMEAMAMEIPVVMTRIAGAAELIADGESGVLVAPGRADELAGVLARLGDDAGLRRRLGEGGRRAVLAGYDLAAIGPQLRDVFAARVP